MKGVEVRWMVAAHCLDYPDAVRSRLPLLRRCLAEVPDAGLGALVEHLERTPPVDAARHYVEVFDTKADRCLHLTWYTDGDTRRRGTSLAAVLAEYRRHGFRPAGGELPDHLPVVLEFCALTGSSALLSRFRPALELVHRNLVPLGTPYAAAVAAVLATVPVRDDARPVAAAPVEQVGREPVLLGYPTARGR